MERVLLPRMRRYLQDAGACAFGAVASVGNYFNRKLNYDVVCKILQPDGEGLYTPDIGILLNTVGFTEVTIITADLDQVDFKWKDLTKNKLVEQLKTSRRSHPDSGCREVARQYVKFLEAESGNNLVIDMHFGDHIRKALDQGVPVLASFNWNLFFNMPKWNEYGEDDPIKGEFEQHEVVIYGYDDKGVNILDSHHEMYKGKLKKYRRGRYRMDWETLMTTMGCGDLIIPGGYAIERTNEQLASLTEEES